MMLSKPSTVAHKPRAKASDASERPSWPSSAVIGPATEVLVITVARRTHRCSSASRACSEGDIEHLQHSPSLVLPRALLVEYQRQEVDRC